MFITATCALFANLIIGLILFNDSSLSEQASLGHVEKFEDAEAISQKEGKSGNDA